MRNIYFANLVLHYKKIRNMIWNNSSKKYKKFISNSFEMEFKTEKWSYQKLSLLTFRTNKIYHWIWNWQIFVSNLKIHLKHLRIKKARNGMNFMSKSVSKFETIMPFSIRNGITVLKYASKFDTKLETKSLGTKSRVWFHLRFF